MQYPLDFSSLSNSSSSSSSRSRDLSPNDDFRFSDSCETPYTTDLAQIRSNAPDVTSYIPLPCDSDVEPTSYAAIQGVLSPPGRNASKDGYQRYFIPTSNLSKCMVSFLWCMNIGAKFHENRNRTYIFLEILITDKQTNEPNRKIATWRK